MSRKLGQHFLKNKSVIAKIISALDLKSGDFVVEIGPGKGALTFPLVEACGKIRCSVVAIEKDAALAKEMDKLSTDKNFVKIIRGDALKELPSLSSSYTLNPTPYKLVGNIPYYITGKLLRTIGELERRPELTVLMIQKEVAERLTTKPPKMNLLAAATQIWGDISIIARLKPADFDPPPEVDSAVVRIESRMQNLESRQLKEYYEFIHAAFKQPRKTLLNNLAEGFGLSKQEAIKILTKNGFNEKIRAQELAIDQLVNLSKVFDIK